ncbi:MAG TPA: GNAT family N-acetyltransferase [Gaiellaceae bacterium]|jgi:ribosomal protein S18 acetylase RimI-like enzyme|nr:GNAT family N-acetyltransferase [Gaiellaceae bacterium]
MEIAPFTDAHVDAAAELLAERHARHREAEPLLPAEVDFRAEVEKDWSADGASGVFSKHGYLLGAPSRRGFTVGIAGHAVDGDVEQARDLYAAAAGRWLEAGHASQHVFLPASEGPLVDAWFRLSFGASAVLAMRETGAEAYDGDVTIRPGTPDDAATAIELDRAMHDSMLPSPSFSGHSHSDEEYAEEWEGTWDADEFVHFVAERGGRVLGHIVLYRRPPDLRVPPGSIDLAAASTLPEARGSGVGRALTAHVLTWAAEHDIPAMTVDWRMTNLWASRFWPRRGFRPTFLRLYRSIP